VIAAFALVGALLGGCGSGASTGPATPASSPGGTSAAPPVSSETGSRVVVTVPGLGTSTGGDEADGAPTVPTSPALGATNGTGTVTVTATANGPGTASGAADPTGATAPPGKATQQTTALAPTTAPRTPTTRTTSTHTTVPRSTSARPSTGAAGGAVTVDLSHCAGCTVIATHPQVSGTLSAALATTSRGAVLLSVRSDGAIAGVINVPYGATFPAPSGKSLPCDSSGRCIVTGRQTDGEAILSAFHLTSDGAWQDVSGDGGFPSATPRGLATDVDGDGLLDIAVQESGDGTTTWMVLTWSGEHFTVLGCAPASDVVPSAGELSPDSCLS